VISTPAVAPPTSGYSSRTHDRGWSWTRYSLIVVRTVPTGTYETTCRDTVAP